MADRWYLRTAVDNMKDGKSLNLERGWCEIGGKLAKGTKQDPKALYEPRFNGLQLEETTPKPPVEEDEVDDDSDTLPIDTKFRKNGKRK